LKPLKVKTSNKTKKTANNGPKSYFALFYSYKFYIH